MSSGNTLRAVLLGLAALCFHLGAAGEARAQCLDNRECPVTAFCSKPEGQCDAPGVCEARPGACQRVAQPVCGCDEVTYSNDCVAAQSGVSIAYAGICGSRDTDGDGIPDEWDNCPEAANADQSDIDGDGAGDVCDHDADGDGWFCTKCFPSSCPRLWLLCNDCDDLDPDVHPEAGEDCGDGIDNDCDGAVDGTDSDCCVATSRREKGKRCRDGRDNDCDTRIDCADSDCAKDRTCKLARRIVIDDPIFFDLPINSLRYAVSGYDPGTDLCVTAIWVLREAGDQIRHCDDFGPWFPYVVIAPGEPAGCWDTGTHAELLSASGCVDWAAFNSPVIPWEGAGSGHTDEVDLELQVTSEIWSGTVRFDGPR